MAYEVSSCWSLLCQQCIPDWACMPTSCAPQSSFLRMCACCAWWLAGAHTLASELGAVA